MVEELEKIAVKSNLSNGVKKDKIYVAKTGAENKDYSVFAEMYLENASSVQAGKPTCTLCTWRGIPTIDDW